MPALVAVAGLVTGGLAYALWSRHRVNRHPGVFRCRVRRAGAVDGSRWSRTRRHARWAHDVLLVHRGLALARCEPVLVAGLTGPVRTLAVKGLGDRPMLLQLLLEDGRLVELATSSGDVVPAMGPFVPRSLV